MTLHICPTILLVTLLYQSISNNTANDAIILNAISAAASDESGKTMDHAEKSHHPHYESSPTLQYSTPRSMLS